MTYTAQQILALSPNSGNASRGQELAFPGKWEVLSFNELAIWGACKGSGKNPYRTVIDLNGPAFKCSCPSREFPCKHGIALFLLFVGMQDKFTGGDEPDWAADWLTKRRQKSETQAQKAAEPVSAEKLAAQEASREKRVANRWDNISAGAAQLETWLHDIIRHGIGATNIADTQFWEQQARRLVDAQMPGLAEMVRSLSSIHRLPDAQKVLLNGLAEIQYVLGGIQNRAELSPAQLADLDYLLGVTTRKEDIVALDGWEDQWQVLGTREIQGNIPFRRTWLKGKTHGKWGLQLDFSFGNQGFGSPRIAGNVVEGKWHFYPGSIPVRGIFSTEQDRGISVSATGTNDNFDTCLIEYGAALSAFPLLNYYPFWVESVCPVLVENTRCLMDQTGKILPVSGSVQAFQRLLALSGGQPIAVMGEWNGKEFWPVSVFCNAQYYAL